MTVKNLEIEEAKEKRREVERKKLAEERKKYTLSMIEKDAKKDFEMERDENALLGKSCDQNSGREPSKSPAEICKVLLKIFISDDKVIPWSNAFWPTAVAG